MSDYIADDVSIVSKILFDNKNDPDTLLRDDISLDNYIYVAERKSNYGSGSYADSTGETTQNFRLYGELDENINILGDVSNVTPEYVRIHVILFKQYTSNTYED